MNWYNIIWIPGCPVDYNSTVDMRGSNINIMLKGPQLADKGPPVAITILETGMEGIKHCMLVVGLEGHVKSAV
jgi:hypothetical protein